ncbi:4'-phosphopantetheinyl transferase superfamily protein [Nitrospirillum sp. BR 11164]|uniref:4'-phosphopantetheinyl transferase family protein n=1 Tax=Nitrospirillum sp. BR 11164 TaxID=3104324 RepID=UPI002B002057|nr:4'-phosphopantetheinyl transferase superfamily protein [Nitrospirillum sp. BR 11164]MEA1652629.1 4'-phosphopantetheinyl transferase superfamily protein [Nitrospirillum sp. BR 11164]
MPLLRTLPLSTLDDAAYARLWPLLDEGEQVRARRFVFEANRREYVAAHGLARLWLGRLLGRPPAALVFTPLTPQGKPGLVGAPVGLDFNLSHTDGLVACAVTLDAGTRIGVDVERGDRRIGAEVATAMFAPEELAWLDARPAGRGGPDLVTFWTLKEAYIKALGLGLSLPTDSFAMAPDAITPHGPALIRHDGSLPPGQACRLWRRDLPSGHAVAVAWMGPVGQPPADLGMEEGLADLW